MGSPFAHLTSEDHREHLGVRNFECVWSGLTMARRSALRPPQKSVVLVLRVASLVVIENCSAHCGITFVQ